MCFNVTLVLTGDYSFFFLDQSDSVASDPYPQTSMGFGGRSISITTKIVISDESLTERIFSRRIKMHKKSPKYAQKKSLGIIPKKWSRNIPKIYKNTKNHEYHESTLFTFVCGYSESYASCSSFKIRVRFSVETSHHFRHIDRRTSSNEPTFFCSFIQNTIKINVKYVEYDSERICILQSMHILPWMQLAPFYPLVNSN